MPKDFASAWDAGMVLLISYHEKLDVWSLLGYQTIRDMAKYSTHGYCTKSFVVEWCCFSFWPTHCSPLSKSFRVCMFPYSYTWKTMCMTISTQRLYIRCIPDLYNRVLVIGTSWAGTGLKGIFISSIGWSDVPRLKEEGVLPDAGASQKSNAKTWAWVS